MSVEENKSLVRRFVDELWNRGNLSIVDDYVVDDFVFHALEKDLKSPEEFKQYATSVRSAFSDFNFIIGDIIAEGNTVVLRWTMTGTHKGEFMGIPATNKKFITPGTSVIRLSKGKLVEVWPTWDRFGLMQQLGVTPSH